MQKLVLNTIDSINYNFFASLILKEIENLYEFFLHY
jgi:hypothetical protein